MPLSAFIEVYTEGNLVMPERDSLTPNNQGLPSRACCCSRLADEPPEWRSRHLMAKMLVVLPLVIELGLALAFLQSAHAQTRYSSDPEYLIEYWQTDQGLP